MQTNRTLKIGLFGESPHDTNAICELLSKEYANRFEFIIMLPRLRGSMLDNKMTQSDLKIEYKVKKPDLVLVVRDLDDFTSNTVKVDRLNKFFDSSNVSVENKGMFLLNIFELEALILSDIDAFNLYYNVRASFSGDPTAVKEPKEILKEFTKTNKNSKKYTPGHCPAIFKTLEFNKLKASCAYFMDFISAFESKIESLA